MKTKKPELVHNIFISKYKTNASLGSPQDQYHNTPKLTSPKQSYTAFSNHQMSFEQKKRVQPRALIDANRIPTLQ